MKVMVDPAFPDHRKLWMLAGELKISEAQAGGHVLFFWCRVMQQSPSGAIKGWSSADLARAANWVGDKELFRKSMLKAGFITKATVHDWIEHQGDILEKRRTWAERWKRKRERDSPVNHGSVTRESRASLPSPSLPSPALPSRGEEDPPPGEEVSHPATPEAEKGAELLADLYLNLNRGVIGKPKAIEKCQFYIDRGGDIEKAKVALSADSCKGKKIWEILDHLNGNGKQVNFKAEADRLFMEKASKMEKGKKHDG